MNSGWIVWNISSDMTRAWKEHEQNLNIEWTPCEQWMNSGWTHRVNTMWTLHQHQVNTTKKFRQKWVWVATREEKISSPSSASLLGEEIFSSLVAIFGTFFASLLGEERFLHPIFYAMRIRWMQNAPVLKKTWVCIHYFISGMALNKARLQG